MSVFRSLACTALQVNTLRGSGDEGASFCTTYGVQVGKRRDTDVILVWKPSNIIISVCVYKCVRK